MKKRPGPLRSATNVNAAYMYFTAFNFNSHHYCHRRRLFIV